MDTFDIPVVLFLFKRTSTLKEIIGRIGSVKPQKVYLIADGGRTEAEHTECEKCRQYAESLITWPCELIKNYAPKNRGVYKNIGEGARWVFSNEEKAIFIEDDNLPEVTFFPYCKEMLEKYNDDELVLWVCGTNYLGKYDSEYSYMFTKHMLPCGWASWKHKFLKYYDGHMDSIKDKKKQSEFKHSYYLPGCKSWRLYEGQLYSARRTAYLQKTNIGRSSWDYQMNYSVRSNGFYGISPVVNQIKNIGIDENSIHGGNKPTKTVLKLCGMPSYKLDFPLRHPPQIEVDPVYEKKINKILELPLYIILARKTIIKVLKRVLGINEFDSFASFLRKNKQNGIK